MLLTGILAAATPAPTPAQVLRGRVVEAGAETGAPGAIVELRDDAGAVVAARLTDSEGRFALRAPAGRYSLRMSRIGHEDVERQVEIGPEGASFLQIDAPLRPLVLPPLEVEGASACGLDPVRGRRVFAVWSEMRKALETTRLTLRDGGHRYRVRLHERILDARGWPRGAGDEATRKVVLDDPQAFHTLPAEDLLRDGFVRPVDDALAWFGPDLEVLLADAFTGTRCFDLREEGGPAGDRIGLRFRPAERHGPPDIRGTLWLDAATHELRSLEFAYARLEGPAAQVRDVGGELEFRRLPSGGWIVSEWRIRVPIFRREHLETGRFRQGFLESRTAMRLIGYEERGGRVVEVLP
ncbi:MAG: carboxypeptidase-like regulatory domain-containing protein [Gemmatimonadota bacterium]|nr:carboxypeptidase-like regulatory domain-containing protein [Gemmatimonadota bacterium]